MTESHTDMVARLVKWGDDQAYDIHHACTGICGEVIELRSATDDANELEELGDIIFYMKHLKLALERWGYALPDVTCPVYITRSIVHELSLTCAGNLLDYGKKCWVYQKDPALLLPLFADDLAKLVACVEFFLRASEHTWAEAENANQEKLSTGPKARYPVGYSDAAAQARADKQGEAG
jgi:hypothetical protein